MSTMQTRVEAALKLRKLLLGSGESVSTAES